MTVIHAPLPMDGVEGWAEAASHAKRMRSLPLTEAPVGQPLRLVALHADHKLVHRLAELGLTTHVTVTVVQKGNGPLLLAVRGARIGIGRELAQQLEVAPLC